MAKSERKQWDRVRAIGNALVLSLPHNQTELRELAFELQNIAKDMLYQLARGVHENPAPMRRNPAPMRRNPPLVLWANPGAQVRLQIDEPLSDRAYEVGYRHLEDGKDYKHKFAEGVSIFSAFMDDQKVLLIFRPDGRAVWKDF